MSDFSVAIWFDGSSVSRKNLDQVAGCVGAERVILCCLRRADLNVKHSGPIVEGPALEHGVVLRRILESTRTKYLALVLHAGALSLESRALEAFASEFDRTKANIVYSAYFLKTHDDDQPGELQALINYQEGSVRDDFDFGGMLCLNVDQVRRAFSQQRYTIPENYSALYGLRLFASLGHLPVRILTPLYTLIRNKSLGSEAEHFRYVARSSQNLQRELESTFTYFAKEAGFFLPGNRECVDLSQGDFPVEASVVIPVRNRVNTIADAVRSALSQRTTFSFNVIVVDNHSSDGTTDKLSGLAEQHQNLVHLVPQYQGLAIGGCWNEAIFSPRAGRFCIQLDSDDLYSSNNVLERIVETFKTERCASVVGTYRLVNFNLEEIPPGVIDHREWSPENGHNNALRINGFGAPRAFFTPVIRDVRFPNVSYGEDYAVMLAISRRFRIGRIYDVLYNCRRWEGNSDASPSVEKLNSFNSYKDLLRTQEIAQRRELALQLAANRSVNKSGEKQTGEA